VLLNLLVNAAQALPEGAAERNHVTVTTRRDGEHVVVEVRDSGRGIAPDVLPRIFDPFFTTRPVGNGIGLGLSIAHRLTTTMGGTITVESKPGQGTLFRVALPLAEPAPASDTPATARRRARVIVIDDEPMVGKAIRRMLAGEHDVVPLTRPEELLALLDGEPIDAVLCDVMMPQMTGMDLYAELQKRAPALLSHFAFLTGGAFTPRAQSFLASVANPKLDKPFDAGALRALIRSLIG
jgi:CheY-like chemotaxis protein